MLTSCDVRVSRTVQVLRTRDGQRSKPARFHQVWARTWLEARPIGQLFYAPFDVVFSRLDAVEPDLLYMSNARAAEIVTEKHVSGVPELVIEIASPGTRKRDETLKRRLYERTGVSEYWVVDPELDVIRVFRRSGETYGRPIELSAEAQEVLTTPLLPGLEIPLARVFGSGRGRGVRPLRPSSSSRLRARAASLPRCGQTCSMAFSLLRKKGACLLGHI